MTLSLNKKLLVSAFALVSGFANVAAAHDYGCIAQTLEAYNPKLYSNLSPSDIDSVMNGVTDRRRQLFIQVAMYCDNKANAADDQGDASL
ncbi:MAG: hypothetical protein ACJ763_13525 [Bdellovibrionia bacterium]